MARFAKFIGKGFIAILLLLILIILLFKISWWWSASSQMRSLGPEAPTLSENGTTFRDLNKNGKLDVYENSRAPIDARVNDILSQMTLEEKAGVMFIEFTSVGENGKLRNIPKFTRLETLITVPNSELVAANLMNHASLMDAVDDTAAFANWANAVQKISERTRLGIPMTFASDPRHGPEIGASVGMPAGQFSIWPDALGLAAARDPELTRQFADIARQEYRAVGIHVALHPVADLATEPRWARISGTFGEDAHLSAELVKAYVTGMQGESLDPNGVATMVKHFSGGGPQMDGEDAHFHYGKEQVYPGENFDYHLIPFEEGAFPAGAAQIMPYYGIPMGQTSEDVGFAFNKEIITDLLRNHYKYDGVVCTDWGLISDSKLLGIFTILKSRSHGVEGLTKEQRMIKIIEAGNDQFGGEHIPQMLVKLVQEGKISEARLDISVRRLLRDKFRLGLFDNPYVDAEAALNIVGSDAFMAAGIEAQKRSLVLLKNGTADQPILPLTGKPKIYVENIDPAAAAKYGEVVDAPEEADFAIVRIHTPFEPRKGVFEQILKAGYLDFRGEEKRHLLSITERVPTIFSIHLERAAVIPEIAAGSEALIADFNASDDVLLGAVFGEFSPTGKLPLELPSSMEAVRNQMEDMPYDSKDPLYKYGHGLTYDHAQ